MEYRELPVVTRADLDDAMQQPDGGRIARTLLGLVQIDPDAAWVQQQCLQLLAHEDQTVRAAAALSLGHLARIHRQIDRESALPALEQLRQRDPSLSGRIDDAMDDIETFA